MADVTDTSPATTATPADAVPERPQWLNGTSAKPTTQAEPATPPRRRSKRQPLVLPVEDEDTPLPWQTRVAGWLRSAAATGYGLSLIVHLFLLTAMALYIFPTLSKNTDITTVVESDSEVPEEFDMLQDVQLDSPAGSEETVKPQLTEVIQQDTELNMLEHNFLTDVTAAETKGEGGATTGTGGGIRLLEPKNAVRKGSFTAWTIPIAMRVGEKPEAGDSPRPGQAYFIAIQVKLPADQRTYRINDLSGEIIGTDDYQQNITAHAYAQDKNGKILPVKTGRRLPIVDGVAQILVRVPGADALVKDTISIQSRALKEQQTLELVFGQPSR